MGMDQSGPTSIVSNAKVKIPQIANGFNVPSQFDLACEFEGGHKARIFSGNNELIIKGDKGKIRVNRRGLSGKPAEDLGVAHKSDSQLVARALAAKDRNGSKTKSTSYVRTKSRVVTWAILWIVLKTAVSQLATCSRITVQSVCATWRIFHFGWGVKLTGIQKTKPSPATTKPTQWSLVSNAKVLR